MRCKKFYIHCGSPARHLCGWPRIALLPVCGQGRQKPKLLPLYLGCTETLGKELATKAGLQEICGYPGEAHYGPLGGNGRQVLEPQTLDLVF